MQVLATRVSTLPVQRGAASAAAQDWITPRLISDLRQNNIAGAVELSLYNLKNRQGIGDPLLLVTSKTGTRTPFILGHAELEDFKGPLVDIFESCRRYNDLVVSGGDFDKAGQDLQAKITAWKTYPELADKAILAERREQGPRKILEEDYVSPDRRERWIKTKENELNNLRQLAKDARKLKNNTNILYYGTYTLNLDDSSPRPVRKFIPSLAAPAPR